MESYYYSSSAFYSEWPDFNFYSNSGYVDLSYRGIPPSLYPNTGIAGALQIMPPSLSSFTFLIHFSHIVLFNSSFFTFKALGSFEI
jgi:hypothetical protein